MFLPGAVDHNASGGRRCGRVELGFLYAHRRCPPDSSLEADDLAEAGRGVSASSHTHASGVRISPVGTQAQVTRPVFRIERSLLFIGSPFLERAGATEPTPAGRRSAQRHEPSVGEGRVLNYRLTRSLHRSYAVMSGEEPSLAGARGGFRSAHRNTGKTSGYLEVLVRIPCS